MNKEIKKSFPAWVDNDKKYYMCLTDDIDSLFSCILLQQIKGYELSHFYSFSKLYRADNYKNGLKLCGIDMDLNVGRCWGNHTTLNKNENSANINVIKGINENTYYSKYAGSTALEIISYYDYDISNLTEEALMVLLAIDGMYIPFFPLKIDFSGTQRRYLKYMELDILIDVAERHTKQEFINIIEKYKLNKKIFMNEDGELKTSIDLNGLSKLFNLPFCLPKINIIKQIHIQIKDYHYINLADLKQI
ncbi:hypothetical protein [Clostridium sp. DMHC 10]|uniref:hypothetical protein n=1 Tax=Clostridium sp. DMHC 10 TaxID=747377 RepID=UPI00069F68B6|nr:hypothetical protein [Clostridium sp. DMHC 10]